MSDENTKKQALALIEQHIKIMRNYVIACMKLADEHQLQFTLDLPLPIDEALTYQGRVKRETSWRDNTVERYYDGGWQNSYCYYELPEEMKDDWAGEFDSQGNKL